MSFTEFNSVEQSIIHQLSGVNLNAKAVLFELVNKAYLYIKEYY